MRAISVAAIVVGVLILTQGVVGLAAPTFFLNLISAIQKPPVIYGAAVARILIGLVLVLSARSSRTPRLLGAFGILVAIGGLLTPILGARFAAVVLGWWSGGGATVVRGWAAAALLLGAFVLYSVWPKRKIAA